MPALPHRTASAMIERTGLGLVAFVAGQVKAIQLLVDVRHEQALSSRIGLGEAAREEVAGRCKSVELERPFGTLMAHAFQLCGGAPSRDSNSIRIGHPFRSNPL
jgi:hypothetical protein